MTTGVFMKKAPKEGGYNVDACTTLGCNFVKSILRMMTYRAFGSIRVAEMGCFVCTINDQ
jgi:hypothetical protein